MLKSPMDEPIVQIQRVDHESRVHIDIETDDIPAEVARGEAGRFGGRSPEALGGDAGAHRSALLRRPGAAAGLPEERQPLALRKEDACHCVQASWLNKSTKRCATDRCSITEMGGVLFSSLSPYSGSIGSLLAVFKD